MADYGPYYRQTAALTGGNLDPYFYSGLRPDQTGQTATPQTSQAITERYGTTDPNVYGAAGKTISEGGTSTPTIPSATTPTTPQAGQAIPPQTQVPSGGGGGTPLAGQIVQPIVNVAGTVLGQGVPYAGFLMGGVVNAFLSEIFGWNEPHLSQAAKAAQAALTNLDKVVAPGRVTSMRQSGMTDEQIVDWAKSNNMQYLVGYVPKEESYAGVAPQYVGNVPTWPGGVKTQISGLYTPEEAGSLENYISSMWGIGGPPEMPWMNIGQGNLWPIAEGYAVAGGQGWSPNLSDLPDIDKILSGMPSYIPV